MTARFVISSVGGYVNAKTDVDIAGVDDFAGTILRPNAWDDDYDTRGKRIAVIGTGSSGVQIAGGTVQPRPPASTSTSGPRRGCCPRSTSTSRR